MAEEVRINKYLSSMGVCSRREADRLIENGEIHIDGRPAVMGDKVRVDGDRATNEIAVKGKILNKAKPERTVIAYNKPCGIECTADKKNKQNILDAIGYRERLIYMGRLDKNSHGLILLTTDGELVNKVMKSVVEKEKEYIVKVNKDITDKFIYDMGNGVDILDTKTKKCIVWKVNNNTFGIVLTQGLNRQIRRMCEALGYGVKDLKRIRIENIKLDGIKEGEYRTLSNEEIKVLENGRKK